jgi:hypothetical protein
MKDVNREIRKRNNAQRTEYNKKYREANRQRYNQWERDYYARKKTDLMQNQRKWRQTIKGFATTAHLAARQRAKKKGLLYELSPALIESMIRCQGEKCSLTSIPFAFDKDDAHRYRPLDRKSVV